MRSMRQLRHDKQVPVESKRDSEYRAITEREAKRKFNPLKIPRQLEKALPYASKPKLETKRSSSKPTLEQRRAVLMEPKVKKIKIKKNKKNKRSTKSAACCCDHSA